MKILAATALALLAMVPSAAHAVFNVPGRFTAKELDFKLPKVLKEVTAEFGKSIFFESTIEVKIGRIDRHWLELRFPVMMHAHLDGVEDAGATTVTFKFMQLKGAHFQWELGAKTARSLEEFVRCHAPGFSAIDCIKRNPAIGIMVVSRLPLHLIALTQPRDLGPPFREDLICDEGRKVWRDRPESPVEHPVRIAAEGET